MICTITNRLKSQVKELLTNLANEVQSQEKGVVRTPSHF